MISQNVHARKNLNRKLYNNHEVKKNNIYSKMNILHK